MFDQTIPPTAGAKGTVPMTVLIGGEGARRARPKGRIVGKDQPRQHYRDLLLLPDGRVLAGYRGRHIGSPFGLQVRAGDDLSVAAELPDAGPPFDLHGGGRLLASGPLWGGYQPTVCTVDLATLAVRDTAPLCRPYRWLGGPQERFVGQTPASPSFGASPHADPAPLDRHPHLRRWVEGDHGRRLLLVGRDGEVERVLDAAEVGPEYPVFQHLSLSPDGAALYAATDRSVAAVSPADWSIRWKVRLGDNDGPRFLAIYAMALDRGGRRLAVGGLAGHAIGEHTLAVLDAANGRATPAGRDVGRAAGGTSIRSLAWHPGGWLAAGTASGLVIHVDAAGAIRTWKGASGGIESLLFIDGGRSLLVCGAEKHFRVWPLLEDEAGAGA